MERIDLYEQNNLIEKNPILGEEMEKTLNKIRQKLSEKFEKPSIDKDEAKKVEEELKKLGYI